MVRRVDLLGDTKLDSVSKTTIYRKHRLRRKIQMTKLQRLRIIIFQGLTYLVAVTLLAAVVCYDSQGRADPVGNSTTDITESVAGTNAPKGQHRIREGTKVADLVGHFKLTGDRVAFYTADGNIRFGGLENLNLERIARVVKDSHIELQWTVSGLVTEYRGTNYLLVAHAVLKSKRKKNHAPLR